MQVIDFCPEGERRGRWMLKRYVLFPAEGLRGGLVCSKAFSNSVDYLFKL